MTDIFVRAFTDNYFVKSNSKSEWHNSGIRIILDTETSVDEYQNLTFGSCLVKYRVKENWFLFYGDIPPDKLEILEDYGAKHNTKVLSVCEFVDKVFFKYAYYLKGEVIGFNLPFDLSRLAVSFGVSRKTEGAFSLTLSNNPFYPRIQVKAVDQKRSFMSFMKPFKAKMDYRGYFVDLKTLVFALTDKSHSLDSACKDFGVSRKQQVEAHGQVNDDYISYNLHDVKITSELYEAALQRYKMFGLTQPVNQLYSPASIGKAYLRKMGVKPFIRCNTDFPREVLGYVMSTYFGGRTEVRIRNTPVRVTYLDFTSMYPTVYSLLQLDKFLKAKTIKFIHNYENTDKIKGFLNTVTITDLRKKDTWSSLEMHTIVKIKPEQDVLPVRMEYTKTAKNIGVNYLTCEKGLWFTVQDVVASIIITGKQPKILDAYTFVADDRQEDLKEVAISDIVIKPEEDFICKLIEERIKIKKSSRADKDQIQLILKIIANATSYGIFIEETRKELKKAEEVNVYSTEFFKFKTNKLEVQGEFFNPIMATFITASSRLILTMAEKITLENKGCFAYCDTDSIFVSPHLKDTIQEFFRPLNPYCEKVEMFKVEEDDEHKPIDNVLFYGVSAKRYCLYHDETNIIKYSTHGLGHIKDVDGKEVWKSILTGDYSQFDDKIAVTQITTAKPSIMERFEKMNHGKPLCKQIKPFNFVLVGTETNGVIPLIPFTKNLSGVEFRDFIDYKTNAPSSKLPLQTYEYWKTLGDVLINYKIHNDKKFDYDSQGVAYRKPIIADKIRYIGKESNNLDENLLGVSDPDYLEYVNNEDFKQWVLNLKHVKNISDGVLRNFKHNLREKGVKNNSKTLRILISLYNSK